MGKKNYTTVDHLISKPTKESEPSVSVPENTYLKEVVEHQIEEEVKPYVSPRAETIELPPDIKKLGVHPSTTSQFSTYQNVKLPLADDKILPGLHAPITSSLRWLATLAIYILRHAHLGLKKIHGRVVRVVNS